MKPIRCKKALLLILTLFVAACSHTPDTRIGRLSSENGFPSEETARKLFDEMDYQRAWVIGPYLRVIGEYRKTLEKYPNPKAVNLTEFGR